jgi:fluoroacetyl-CoA thioesterase
MPHLRLTVTVRSRLENVEGKKLTFSIIADDGIDVISEGTHERFIISAQRFNAKVNAKAMSINSGENRSP